MRAPIVLLVPLFLLSGCLGTTVPVPSGGPGEGAEAPLETLRFAAADCRELIVGIPADSARVAAALPHGLKPAPMTPAGVGGTAEKTLLRLSILDCATGNASGTPVFFHLAELYVGVVAPEGSHGNTAIYDFAVYASDAHAIDVFGAGGWPMASAYMGYARTRGPAGPGALTATWNGDGFSYELQGSLDTTRPSPFPGAAMSSFRDVEGTLREFEWDLGPGSYTLTGSGVLRASPGSPLATLLGATDAPATVTYATFATFEGRLRPLQPAMTAGPTL